MVELPSEIIEFFHKQGFVIVSTLDSQGKIHCSAKGIVGIEMKVEEIVDLAPAQLKLPSP